jgi:hypothetical protein
MSCSRFFMGMLQNVSKNHRTATILQFDRLEDVMGMLRCRHLRAPWRWFPPTFSIGNFKLATVQVRSVAFPSTLAIFVATSNSVCFVGAIHWRIWVIPESKYIFFWAEQLKPPFFLGPKWMLLSSWCMPGSGEVASYWKRKNMKQSYEMEGDERIAE